VARGLSPESLGRTVYMISWVYCIASLFYYVFVLSPAPTRYIILLLWCDIAYLCRNKPKASKQTLHFAYSLVLYSHKMKQIQNLYN